MPVSFSPTRCHVNLAAIKRNFQRLGAPGALMPVIKSDAYGHGLLPVAGILDEAGARSFAIGGASEGEELRNAGFGQRLLLLTGCRTPDDWETAALYGLLPLVNDFKNLEMAAACPHNLEIAIKCDSGMWRLGFGKDDIPAIAEKIRNSSNLKPVMAVSHFASSDMPEDAEYAAGQMAAFEDFARALAQIFPAIGRSLGNSAAALGLPDAAYDVLRPGLAIYGGNPFFGTSRENAGAGLEWAMSISTPILQVKRLAKGQSVSYGRIFRALRDMDVAVVSCGYSQGLARGLSGRCDMLVRGRRVPQIGRICMSMCMLDVSSMPDAAPGELAWPLGGPAAAETSPVDAWELAMKLDTVPYELLCLMGSLNLREYENN